MTTDPTKITAPQPDSSAARHDWRLGRFPNLMRHRVQEILLVSSAYNSFILEEDGLLTEMVYTEYVDLGLTHAPNITRVSAGEEALRAIRGGQYDLIITMPQLGDMDIPKFGEAVRDIDARLPLVLLTSSEWELARITHNHEQLNVDNVYVWQGDTKLFLAIIKSIEDRLNVANDAHVGDVGVIIVVEDSVRFRSSLLPLVYSELVKQTRAVMAEGLNHMDKRMRMRARPKVLVADTYERGMAFYRRFHKQIFGIITDVAFKRNGRPDPAAGIRFIREIQADHEDVPALLQSSNPDNAALAEQIGARFLHKRSDTLLEDLRQFMLDNFGFGDFVFRLPDGSEVARAADLNSMAQVLHDVPAESVAYHATRNHFSNWLRARTEFALARRIRPRRVSEFDDLEDLRRFLIHCITEAIGHSRRGVVADFSRQRFDAKSGFARIGGGSLGGKARGLAFLSALLATNNVEHEFDNTRVYVPPSVVIGSDVFDQFLNANGIRHNILRSNDFKWITKTFLAADLPDEVTANLRVFLDVIRNPLAVRSSSLLEDSQLHPFAGVYDTHMLANNSNSADERLKQLANAIKLVYASTYSPTARHYLDATPFRIEEEKMSVILQPIVGTRHGRYFYPNAGGVARSYNYYPFGAMKPEDGVANVALGLGITVVDGGQSLRFCPAYPHILPQLAGNEAFIDESQRSLLAIDLQQRYRSPHTGRDDCIVELDLEHAESDGTLDLIGSVWSPDNQAFYDGIHRPGVRVITFAHVLKSDVFPLAAILQRLLALGHTGMNTPVEVEFAANFNSSQREFAVLQLRPCAAGIERNSVKVDDLSRDKLLLYSPHALGNGRSSCLQDVIYVKPDSFDPAHTNTMAEEIEQFNKQLMADNRPCLLIGPGRWGSSHTWLGIPVDWSQICAARIIVETTLQDFVVEPSQGSHFFQNLTAFGIAYLTINPFSDQGFIDWGWLDNQPAVGEGRFVRHLRLRQPLEARIDGETSHAAILKHAEIACPK